ncbi:hypothetical protein [Streptacidiphilus jiangxiensis]|uniref:Tat (Twin-arginine translocation) pathway signal sequence n=1 Tax=Streptacidiphilus jiangxiensis TaxID=235985 RepID=A0A1H7NSE0_STRJI|nr:hypothetical protein [Streptacidiphilus jiangxiensis]SEL26244.1 hypothetical protein SAMN05414137_10748 [Streptacidiphilus jiangxiensis]
MPETLDTSPSPMTRRGLIKHAGVAGAATFAAGFALNAGLAGTAAATGRKTKDPEQGTAALAGEPFMVHVVDSRTGELDIFHGHRHHRVRDHKLVAQLLRAAR